MASSRFSLYLWLIFPEGCFIPDARDYAVIILIKGSRMAMSVFMTTIWWKFFGFNTSNFVVFIYSQISKFLWCVLWFFSASYMFINFIVSLLVIYRFRQCFFVENFRICVFNFLKGFVESRSFSCSDNFSENSISECDLHGFVVLFLFIL